MRFSVKSAWLGYDLINKVMRDRKTIAKERAADPSTGFGKGVMGEANPMFGKRHSVDSRLKMMSAKAGRFSGDENPMHGKKHTPEALSAISEARRGRVWVNRNGEIKSTTPGELDNYIMMGWDRGRGSKS